MLRGRNFEPSSRPDDTVPSSVARAADHSHDNDAEARAGHGGQQSNKSAGAHFASIWLGVELGARASDRMRTDLTTPKHNDEHPRGVCAYAARRHEVIRVTAVIERMLRNIQAPET